jgi:hypothetical protein
MVLTKLSSVGRGTRIKEPRTGVGVSHMRQMDAPAAYRVVDFYLIYVTISVEGFKMSWTARSRTPGDCGSAGVASSVTDAMNGDGRTDVHATQIAGDDRNGGTNLCLVREFSTVATSGAACAIQWHQVTTNSGGDADGSNGWAMAPLTPGPAGDRTDG